MTEQALAAPKATDIPDNNDVSASHAKRSDIALLKRTYVNVRVSRYARNEIGQIQSQTAMRTAGQVIDYLIETAATKNPLPTATLENIFSDDRPVQLCGGSGTGKSLFVKSNLATLCTLIRHPVLVIDPANEYDLPKIGLQHFFSKQWTKATQDTQLRFVPSSASLEVSKVELRTVFGLLNNLRHDGYKPSKLPSGKLSSWIFIVEESHRLARESVFLTFLSEARKHVAKLIVVCSDPTVYGHICRLVKPPSLEELRVKT